MRFAPLLIAVLVFSCLASCSPGKHAIRKNNRKVERKADRRSGGVYVQYTPEKYIRRFHKVAVRKMKTCHIPASITLAQALLESGTGNSALARYANNHFGIKCTPDWNGRKYYRDDDRKNDCFRVYKTPEQSFDDHSAFLKRPRYQALFRLRRTDYKGWAYGLKEAGYATNPDYPQLLIGLIERNDLHQYDRKDKSKRSRKVRTPAVRHDNSDAPGIAPASAQNLYTVRKGDTLYSISQRFGLTVEQLKRMNGIKGTTIVPGQKLAVQR